MRFTAVGFLALLLVPALAAAGPLEDGEAAYNHGEYQTALKLLQPLADQGNAEAQLGVGKLHQIGLGVKKDSSEAMKWMLKAGNQGLADAQANVGLMYQYGHGVKKDYPEALKWYRKAAEQGDMFSESALGLMYVRGDGTPINYVEAVKWLRKAAEQDYQTAQGVLAKRYAKGQGVKQDYGEVYFWLGLYQKHGINYSGDDDRQIDDAAKHLTPEQLAAVQKRVKEWKPTHPAPAQAIGTPETK